MKKIYRYFFISFVFCFYSLPLSVFATTTSTFDDFVYGVASQIANYIIIIIVSLSLLSFLWGLARFILSAGSDTGREKGKKIMVWGLVALFVMVSLMGIVTLIRVTLFGDTFDAFLPIS